MPSGVRTPERRGRSDRKNNADFHSNSTLDFKKGTIQELCIDHLN